MRKLIVLSTLCMFALCIAGCGGESEPTTSSNGVAPKPTTDIPKAPGKPTGKAVE